MQPDEQVGASEPADHVPTPSPHESVGPVRSDDGAAEEPTALVAWPGRRPEGRCRPGRRADAVRGDDAEGVARRARAHDTERDVTRVCSRGEHGFCGA